MDSGFVIFDLDGTLFDTRGDIVRAVNAGLAALGQPSAAHELIISFVGDGLGRLVDRCLEAVGAEVTLAPRVSREILAFYQRHPADLAKPYPGVSETLDGLGSIPLVVASNKPTGLCEQILAHFGWGQRFLHVLGGDWGGPRKPDPAMLLELACRLGRYSAEGIMVGDTVMDLRAGQGASMRTVAALYGFRPEPELRAAGPDRYAPSGGALLPVLLDLLGTPPEPL